MHTFLSDIKNVKNHYEQFPYPKYPLFASVPKEHTYALNLQSLWARYRQTWISNQHLKRTNILLAGSGSFSPYPTAIANSQSRIYAIDLSKKNLFRAKLHSSLHGCFNIRFFEESLTNICKHFPANFFHFIDCYGVLHHIPSPQNMQVLSGLSQLLAPQGLIRLMIYSKAARARIESARRAFKALKINNLNTIKHMLRRSSTLAELVENNFEATFDSGIADMFLHPYSKTFTFDELLEMLYQAELTPLEFLHPGREACLLQEIKRVRLLEKQKKLNFNFTLFASKKNGMGNSDAVAAFTSKRNFFVTSNPMLRSPWIKDHLLLPGKFGIKNPALDKKFLSSFHRIRDIRDYDSSSPQLKLYLDCHFLVKFHQIVTGDLL
ncbi:MAG: class I SAM-dependent methyltransferase [Oligoflexia bacterium]|nr:class I SAM-dependent methyltransferase [Oligoflexia bacterium]MBF0364282.1 class I SAM-dependent methyltransferase [Oligoflexia bacterium]